MSSTKRNGFTLFELMIVIFIIGILAVIAIPNYIAMQNRAKENSTKMNMHTFQLAVEDYGVQNDGCYPMTDQVELAVALLPGNGRNFKNAFTGDIVLFNQPESGPGDLFYWSDGTTYAIRGMGRRDTLVLVLTSGQ